MGRCREAEKPRTARKFLNFINWLMDEVDLAFPVPIFNERQPERLKKKMKPKWFV